MAAPAAAAAPAAGGAAAAAAAPEPARDFFGDAAREANRYTIREVIGKGSYGVVCSAVDNFTGERVAIKKITNVFEHVSDATRILREIKLLRLLKHPDIVEIKHIMLPPSPRDFKDIYVVFELMETDLHQVIKANDDLTPGHHQFFLYQLLRGLKYIHSAGVFHRDLKPKNILANADCKLKICDFGLARPEIGDAPTALFWTDYVATRWYRAPELCGSFFGRYSPAIDTWSVGCIFAEVLLHRPLFPGRNVVHQLELITDCLGTPAPEVIAKVRNEKARRFLAGMRRKPGSFDAVFAGVDARAAALLRRLLAFDPSERPSAGEKRGRKPTQEGGRCSVGCLEAALALPSERTRARPETIAQPPNPQNTQLPTNNRRGARRPLLRRPPRAAARARVAADPKGALRIRAPPPGGRGGARADLPRDPGVPPGGAPGPPVGRAPAQLPVPVGARPLQAVVHVPGGRRRPQRGRRRRRA